MSPPKIPKNGRSAKALAFAFLNSLGTSLCYLLTFFSPALERWFRQPPACTCEITCQWYRARRLYALAQSCAMGYSSFFSLRYW